MSIATLPLALTHVSLTEWDEDYSHRPSVTLRIGEHTIPLRASEPVDA